MSDSEITIRKRAIWISAGVGLVMLVMKVTAFLLTGSAAILSDALESVVHILATTFALYSVIKSSEPPDRTHPYGHGNIEFFSAGFEGGLIMIAAVAIVVEVIRGLILGHAPQRLDAGILLTLIAGIVNLALGWYLIRAGRETDSLVLVADGRHVLTDSYTSFGVIVGLALVRVTGQVLLDPLVALLVALNILVTGGKLVREAIGGLMHEWDEETLRSILDTIRRHRVPTWIDVHHLRSWRSGEQHYVDLHLTIPRYWDIDQAHAAQEELEALVLDELDVAGEAIVHFDPCVPECCSFCEVQDCPVRSEEKRLDHPWSLERATGEPAHTVLPVEFPRP